MGISEERYRRLLLTCAFGSRQAWLGERRAGHEQQTSKARQPLLCHDRYLPLPSTLQEIALEAKAKYTCIFFFSFLQFF